MKIKKKELHHIKHHPNINLGLMSLLSNVYERLGVMRLS